MAFANPNAPNLPDFWEWLRTSMAIPQSALPGPVGTPLAPTLTAGTGGSLPTGAVYAKVTLTSKYGETLPSAEASVSVTGPSGQVTVTSPAAALNGTGYNVYASAASGAETLQNTTPVAIGAAYVITSLAAGSAPPTVDTSGSPWPGYALTQAGALVIQVAASGIDYTLATYNCAGHILLNITPDVPGSTYFTGLRGDGAGGFNLNAINPGIVSSASDQGTSDSLVVPDFVKGLQLLDLDFIRTPWGRWYLGYNQSFGDVFGLT